MHTAILKERADVWRMQRKGHATERVSVATNVPCKLIPSSPETATTATTAGLEVSKAFDLFFEVDANVQESDKVIIDGVDYYIEGKRTFKNAGPASHIQCIAQIKDPKDS